MKETGVKSWQLSIDGFASTHDKFRYPGSFSNTIEAIELLKRNNIKVSIMTTVSDKNYMEIPDLVKFIYSKGVDKWDFARWIPKNGNCGINPKSYGDFLKRLIKIHRKYEQDGKPVLEKEPLIHTLRNQEVAHNDNIEIISGCGIGTTSLTILPDLTIMACRRHQGSKLKVLTRRDKLIDVFLFNEKLENLRQYDKIEHCHSCRFVNRCRGCRAASFANSNSIYACDPQCLAKN